MSLNQSNINYNNYVYLLKILFSASAYIMVKKIWIVIYVYRIVQINNIVSTDYYNKNIIKKYNNMFNAYTSFGILLLYIIVKYFLWNI